MVHKRITGLLISLLIISAMLISRPALTDSTMSSSQIVSEAVSETASEVVSNRAATAQVQAQLIASVDSVQPGSEIYLGVQQIIIPHWHTYWLNPGDSGLPTTIEWTLPAGSTSGDILWPTPGQSRIGPIVNFGYENEVTLLSKVKVSPDLKAGDTFSIKAKVDWLVCAEECIPQQVLLALDLPVVAKGQALGGGSPLIQQSLARMPVESPLPITTEISKDYLTITINGLGVQSSQIKSVWFYPEEWGRIKQSNEQPWKIVGDNIELTIQTGEAPLKLGEFLKGVLVVTEQGAENIPARGFIVSQALVANSNFSQESVVPENGKQELGLLTALLLALLGGIILNLMPCVFPVLSIKVLSLVAHSNQSAKQIRAHGYIYALGVLTSFLALGIILILFKAAGAQIGWGFQFQSPIFVLLVAYLLFAVGLSLSGVFFIGGSVSNVGASLTERSGYTGSFFTGVLATIVATPCTAPFMAAALGYALAQPPLILIAIFLALGLGLALPYVLLTHWPALQRWLPRPGLWMERVKQALAFPMYAAAVWLIWVLAQQSGANAVAAALGGMILIAIAAWLYDSTRSGSSSARQMGNVFALLVLIASFAVGYFGLQLESTNDDVANTKGEKHWEMYSEERLNNLLAEGKPVFLNFTAAWCISCLANERVALSNQRVIDAFKSSGITYLKGDWTKRDSEITKVLKKFDRSGVPLYVYYPAGEKNQPVNPVELPQILTPDIVLNAVQPMALNP